MYGICTKFADYDCFEQTGKKSSKKTWQMKKYALLILALLAVAVSCTKMRNIRITDYSIAELENIGFTGVRATVRLSIDNPAKDFTVTSISGTVKRDGRDFAEFDLDSPVSVPYGNTSDCMFPMTLSLSGSISPFEMLGVVSSIARAEGITVDATVKLKMKQGIRHTVRVRDVKFDEIMDFVR